MRRETKPTYHATDGTIFNDPLSAATHDAKLIFDDMFDDACISSQQLAAKWLNIREKLSALHNEYVNATTPIPYFVGIPENVFWDNDKYTFVTRVGTPMGEVFKRLWIFRKDEFLPLPQADEPDAMELAPDPPAPVDLETKFFKLKLREDRPRFPGDDGMLHIPGETDPRG